MVGLDLCRSARAWLSGDLAGRDRCMNSTSRGQTIWMSGL
jgi:hypothetical protein